MRTALWVLLGLAAIACGRTAPVREREWPGGGAGGGQPMGGGSGSVHRDPLLVDLDFGELSAHELDGGLAFRTKLVSNTRGRSFETLRGTVGLVVPQYFDDSPFSSLALVGRDGLNRWPSNLFAVESFLNERGLAVRVGGLAPSGAVLQGQTVQPLSVAPDGPVTSTGAVPTFEPQWMRLHWWDTTTDRELRATTIGSTKQAWPAADHFYGSSGTAVFDSTVDVDVLIPTPFEAPSLIAVNTRGQALVSNPNSEVWLADFTTGTLESVSLTSPGMTSLLLPSVGLYLDDEGFIYSSFVTSDRRVLLMRTSTLGQSWTKVSEFSAQGVTYLRSERRGSTLLVVAVVSRGPDVFEAHSARVVDLTTGAETALPIAAQADLRYPLLAALTTDGRRVGFFGEGPQGVALSVFDTVTKTTSILDVRALAPDELGIFPALAWLE